jgi:hypothetical protein
MPEEGLFKCGRGTNFAAPDTHFDKLCLFSDVQTEKMEI